MELKATHAVALQLVMHLLLGCREPRDMAHYWNDEAVRRAVGLRRRSDVLTVLRARADSRLRALAGDLALEGAAGTVVAACHSGLLRHGAGYAGG